ncbi:class I SAM-dependent methyltransferase [uncultured Enterovirga sp.]|uniref:class I SAM-dependent methyltransferase n=1 Tax=uncultured Enterovirga sp. TaxID=2026352 RepID=UPI0035CB5293
MTSSFDAYGSSYGDVVQRSIAFSGLKHDVFLRAKVRVLSELFGRHFPARRPALLDVGCGVGAMHDLIRPIAGPLGGCDPSGESLAAARLRHPDIDYRQQTDETLPWPDAAFDTSLAVCVFHHVAPERREALLAEMRRVTRPGGLVVLMEHNPWNPLTRLAVARCPFDDDAVLLDAREARGLLRGGGLHGIRSRHFLALPSDERWAGILERPLGQLPLGAQYVAYGRV